MKYLIITSVLLALFLAPVCETHAQTAGVSGAVSNLHGVALPGVTVKALDTEGNVVASTQTDANGNYLLSGLPTGITYTIVPEKTDDPLNGLSVLDLLLLRIYILGVQPPPSPYSLLAADINQSLTVTTLDLVQTGRVLLGHQLPLGLDWRFYRDNIVFDNPANPFGGYSGGAPDIFLTENTTGFGFTGVKPGDLDGSAMP